MIYYAPGRNNLRRVIIEYNYEEDRYSIILELEITKYRGSKLRKCTSGYEEQMAANDAEVVRARRHRGTEDWNLKLPRRPLWRRGISRPNDRSYEPRASKAITADNRAISFFSSRRIDDNALKIAVRRLRALAG